MPENQSRPPQPWENGWAPDTSRPPGTRRLYLAGALAVATIVACVTAIAWTDKGPETLSQPSPSGTGTLPGLISFGTPSQPEVTPPKGKSGLTTDEATTSTPRQQGSASPSPAAHPTTKPPSSHPSSKAPKPTTTWRSVRSVNYPDRYWHVSGGYVKLDPVGGSESREDSTFKLVKGLSDSSCYSFATADGQYLRHRNFILVANRNDGSPLFHQDATFCPHASSVPGAIMLESVNYPGRFLRHQNFQLKLDPYQYNNLYRQDSAFRLVAGLA